jgi:hypothetical protein
MGMQDLFPLALLVGSVKSRWIFDMLVAVSNENLLKLKMY